MAVRDFIVYVQGKLPLHLVHDGRCWYRSTLGPNELKVKVGNEGEVPLPRHVLEKLQIKPGQAVELRAEAGSLIISKVQA